MTVDRVRLTLRLNRFELLAFGGIILFFIVEIVVAGAWIDSLRPAAACLDTDGGPTSVGCDLAFNAWYSAQNGVAGLGAGLAIFLSFAAALFLGVPIVAREVERGTSRLAWSLAPSRMRWFVSRTIPILVILAVVSFAAGVAVDRFASASSRDPDLASSFALFGFRGLLVASRTLFIFGVAVVVGAVVGRALPSIILAAVVATVGLAGGERVHFMILEREAVAVPVNPDGSGPAIVGAMYFNQQFVLPDGSFVGYEYFNGQDPYDENGNPRYPMVAIVIPGTRYREVETREALVLAGGTFVALLMAGFVVSRRRPG